MRVSFDWSRLWPAHMHSVVIAWRMVLLPLSFGPISACSGVSFSVMSSRHP